MNQHFIPASKVAAALLLLSLFIQFVPAHCQELNRASMQETQQYTDEAGKTGSRAKVEFTQMQDLNPDAPADNRLVKQKWALVVGISKFKEGRLNPLNSAESEMDRSAKEFYDYLIDPQAGRFSEKHVKLLLNSNATRQRIISAISDGFLGSAVGPDDLVIIYFASNAFPSTDGSTYLCAYDCALDNVYGSCISMQNLMSTLKKNLRSDRIVLVLQAAYSGAASLESGAKALFGAYNLDIEKLALGKGYIILSSSRPDQITWGSSFSRNLIAALKKENGLIGLQKAFALARDETEKETLSKDPDRVQSPVWKSAWSGNELVIGTPPVEKISELPADLLKFQSAEAQYLLATQALNSAKLDEALKHYEAAVKINPEYGDALADYGAALCLKNEWSQAAIYYAKAVAAQPEDALFHLNYARVLGELGELEQCKKELERAYELNPKDLTVIKALSNVHLAREPQKAVELLKEALELYPANALLHERLSYAYARTGEAELALAQALESVRLDAGSASAQMTLGSALYYKGSFKEAARAYKEVSRIDPKNIDAYYYLSRALLKSGDKIGSELAMKEFLRLAPESDPRVKR